ncbi:unnamed protein product [Mesocestoides corti]|uniref:Baculoviral IAP repeat-containing protein 5 n=1 Tax=Mesocestoides corti TaxID=53468 RepID=A0A0R3UHS8_MESCO|nr:unnamed protein product [Mesocestoides corti]
MSEFATDDPITLLSGRLATFKNWPYMGAKDKCIPQALAEAGFYHRPDVSEDSVQCFLCQKILGGWNPDEDPMQEHISHCPDCAFVQLFEAHGGGYEKVSRKVAIEAECARFRASFSRIFEEEIKKHQVWFEENLEKLKEAVNSSLETGKWQSSSIPSTTRSTTKKRPAR